MTTTQGKKGGNAPTGLSSAAVGSGGTFAAATYFWTITFVTRGVESQQSAETSKAIVLNGSCNLTWTQPGNQVSKVRIYRGTATGAENILVAELGQSQSWPPLCPAAFTDTNLGGAATPPAITTFASITFDSANRTAPADATVAGFTPVSQQVMLLQAINEWHNVAGVGEAATRAAATAAALGLFLQDV